MSFDLAVYRLCDHRLVEQPLVLQSDRKSLPLPFPLGGNTVDLFYNLDRVQHMAFDLAPRQTLFVDEDITESFDGRLVRVGFPPIKKGVGARRFILKTNGVAVSPNDVDYGRGEIAMPFNTPANALITATYEQDDLSDNRYRDLVFKTPFPSGRFLFQANYTTIKGYCLKCLGRGYLFDWTLQPDGTIPTLVNEEKLIQDIVRFILTDLASDSYRDWLGSRLKGLIGKKIPTVARIKDVITKEVRSACEKLISLQTQQSKFQTVTLNEALQRVINVDVALDAQDPTLWRVSVTSATKAGSEVAFVTQFNQMFSDFAAVRG